MQSAARLLPESEGDEDVNEAKGDDGEPNVDIDEGLSLPDPPAAVCGAGPGQPVIARQQPTESARASLAPRG